MGDKIGKIPEIKSKEQALLEIIKITEDKRSHVTYKDTCDWQKLKFKVIKKLAIKGLT